MVIVISILNPSLYNDFMAATHRYVNSIAVEKENECR